jgi:hypothetical protein
MMRMVAVVGVMVMVLLLVLVVLLVLAWAHQPVHLPVLLLALPAVVPRIMLVLLSTPSTDAAVPGHQLQLTVPLQVAAAGQVVAAPAMRQPGCKICLQPLQLVRQQLHPVVLAA